MIVALQAKMEWTRQGGRAEEDIKERTAEIRLIYDELVVRSTLQHEFSSQRQKAVLILFSSSSKGCV